MLAAGHGLLLAWLAAHLVAIWETAQFMSQRLPIINTGHSLAVDSEVVGILCLANNSGFDVEQVLHSTTNKRFLGKSSLLLWVLNSDTDSRGWP